MLNYNVLLSYFLKINSTRYQKLMAYFKTAQNLWNTEIAELINAGLNAEIAHEFLNWRDNLDVKKIEEDLKKFGIKTISIDEENYPRLLKEIPDPPRALFYRGNLTAENGTPLGVVGTRKHSQYGRQVCEDLTTALSQRKITIVSGLALGIDGIAHEIALKYKTPTIAVLGSGVDNASIAPQNHLNLAKRIIENEGAVLSEYPPLTPATKFTFPARNRIIAGLSLGALIIEAPKKSGALITARAALDYNREVMAVPHSIYSRLGEGNNIMLKLGAAPITTAEDIFNALELDILKLNFKPEIILKEKQKNIIKILNKEPKNIDLIIKETGLTSADVNAELMMMEIKGIIKNWGGNNYTTN